MTDYEVKKKVEYNVDRKTEGEKDLEDASDKMQAGGKGSGQQGVEPR